MRRDTKCPTLSTEGENMFGDVDRTAACTHCLEADGVRQRGGSDRESSGRRRDRAERQRETETEKAHLGTAAYACAVCVCLFVCLRDAPSLVRGCRGRLRASFSRRVVKVAGAIWDRGISWCGGGGGGGICRSVCVWSGLAWQWGRG
ncbi:hypothetical protein LY76DRAFT_57385 [Colletotrichum caudatum]|nr:hypothetical protein LY76DRAFT_57385 [Colletotrichum caudatum]